MRFSATEWKEFLEIGTRESSFDWDIPCGYITFGTCGMSIAKIIKKKWMRKFVNDWRNKTYKQVNDEIRQQEWEAILRWILPYCIQLEGKSIRICATNFIG